MIDYTKTDQLVVIVNNAQQIYGIDYILSDTSVEFINAPTLNSKILISRRTSVLLDQNTYYNVTQNSTTGSGSGATFTVTNTRGTYIVSSTSPGNNYVVGEQLTISYTQVNPAGSSANNITITVDEVVSGGITAFTTAGSGVTNTSVFSLNDYLYTATNIYSFTVIVNNVYQRPNIDYTFSGGTLTFITNPAAGAIILVDSAGVGAYWQYIDTIAVAGMEVSTSSTSLTVGIGTKTLTVSAGLDYSVGQQVQLKYNNSTYMVGTITNYNNGSGSLTVNSTEKLGSGTHASWRVIPLNSFGTSITTDQLGRQVLIGCPGDTATDANGNTITNAGSAYAFDRGVVKYIITNTSQLTYAIPGSFNSPVSVTLNNQYLTNTAQYVDGQFTVSGSNIILSSSVTLTVGDNLEIETNQFQYVQKITANTVIDESKFGQSITICPNNCSVYVGAPLDSYNTGVSQAGMVQRQVNQSRVYGITSSPVANPTLTAGDTLRINLEQVAVPSTYVKDGITLPGNNVAGLVFAINTSGIPNVVAASSPNVKLIGDGITQIFDIGNIYSSAAEYTTVVYIDDQLQTQSVDYTYNNSTQQISFVVAPLYDSVILVVSGKITISVINTEAAVEFDKLTVLPGFTGTAFTDLGLTTYPFTQTVVSPNPTVYGQFGASVGVNSTAINLVVGSPNGDVYEPTTFDGSKTYFDERSTTFFGYIYNSGVAYTYDYLPSSSDSISNPGKFVFGQQVYVEGLLTGDQFGAAVNYRSGRLVVGAPGTDVGDSSATYGSLFVLDNPADSAVWNVIYKQLPSVDVNLINSVYSFDKLLNSTQTYFDYIDPLQGKILGVARRNIDYIGAVDPASYNVGTVHNIGTTWGPAHLGEIWWDTNSVRFVDANQDNLTYASRRWGQVFPGSSIDVYQWTASSVTPANYIGPGTPLSTFSYTTQSDINDQGIITTTYYFWVRGITTTATQYGKTLSPTAIASYILNPSASGLPYIAALSANAVALYNSVGLISAQDTILHVEYDRQAEGGDNDIHTEYEFIADGKAASFLNPNLYRKLLDSFCGVTVSGAAVPDPTLSPGMQYGVQFRPRQSMFTDRFRALENYLIHVNNILAQYPISETRSFNLLNSSEPIPAANTGAWDYEVANLTILSYQNINIVPIGYRYLVLNDSSQQGRWTIYQVDASTVPGQNVLTLAQVQSYDTPLYWNYINWYLVGYNNTVQPVATVTNAAGLRTLSLDTAPIGSSVKVTANGQGKWEIYLRSGVDPVLGWTRVGLQDGTIAFSEVLWNYPLGGFGFDSEVFGATYFDQEPVVETRYILRAINEELFTDDLLIYRNQSLMLMFQFIYSEFTSPNWLVKTSYIDVNHTVRGLYPYELYQPDNQTFVLDYLTEVKPYHVQILAFNLIYDGLDSYQGNLTDYDVPAYWDTNLDLQQFVSPILLPYDYSNSLVQSYASDAASNAQIWLERPWSDWFNAYTLSVQSVTIIEPGSGYTITPTVTVVGDCITPAQLTATINSAGRVVYVTVVDPGEGYINTPTIVFTDTDGTGTIVVPNMGNNLVRSIKTTIKYDRCEYASTIVDWQANVVYNQDELVRYDNRVWSANTTQSSTTFVITEWTAVDAGTYQYPGVIDVNTGLPYATGLNGADRTMGYYTPTANMPGLSLPLLISGIDYPGVQVTAPTFSQNTGYDVGNYDINPYDNISYDEVGRPTYDPSILDARYSSSYLDVYLGTRPADINVDGGAYISPETSHAPEELVPGAEFDTLDMRVYTTPGSDWSGRGHGFPAAFRRYVYDPDNPVLNFKDVLPFPMVVILFDVTEGLALEPLSYDWANYELTVNPDTSAPGDVLDIYVTGPGGGNQLMRQSYLGSQIINGNEIIIPFPTSAAEFPSADSIYEFLIYNGEVPLYEGIDYTYGEYFIDGPDSTQIDTGKTKITFTDTYGATDRINLTAFGYGYNGTTYSYSLPVFETIVVTNPSTMIYTLTNSMEYTNPVNLIVSINGQRLTPYEGIRYIGTGATVTYNLPERGGYSQGLIANNDVDVFVNNIPQVVNIDFVLDPWDGSSARTITFINGAPPAESVILISVRTVAQYWVVGNQLILLSDQGVVLNDGDFIEIVSWNDTREQDILTQVFVGPPGIYETGRPIANPERLLVTLDGFWLFYGIGYIIEGSTVIILQPSITSNSVVSITSFTQSVVPDAMAFRIFQDMRGVQLTYRITPETTTVTTAKVSATDDVIYVENVLALPEPNFENNIWGVITINAERIMYRNRDVNNNTVSGLLRGTAGTAATDHVNGATVYNLGLDNLLSMDYQNYIVSNSTLGDGSTTVFTAESINLLLEDSTIRDESLEVYVGGIRVTSGYIITGEDPAEITFETAIPTGIAVTMLVRRGVTWYNPGAGTPSNGVPLQETNNEIARFLRGN
jgi:hypothetical protein